MSTTLSYVWELLSSLLLSSPFVSSSHFLSCPLLYLLSSALLSLVSSSPLFFSPLIFSSLLPLHSTLLSSSSSFPLLSSPLSCFLLSFPFLYPLLLLLLLGSRFTAGRYFDAVEAVKRSASPSETKIDACFIEVRELCVYISAW